MAWSTMALASASRLTSTLTKVASPPAFRTRSTVSAPAASLNSATTIRAPSPANSRAATRPIPPPPPVMIATLSFSRTDGTSLSGGCAGGSASLEITLAVPIVDHRVVDLLLIAGRVEVVVDHILAEDLGGGLAALELRNCLVQGPRHPLAAGGEIAVALELGFEGQLLLDPVQAVPDRRGVGQVGIHVATGEAILDVQVAAMAHDPEPRCPIVTTPHDVDRRPRQRGVALVRVDVGGNEDRQLPRQLHHPGDEVAERLGHPVGHAGSRIVGQGMVAGLVPQAHVKVPRRARPAGVGIGHEGDPPTVEIGNLLRAVLEDH